MQREISVLWGEKKVVLRETRRAVTPWGGRSVFVAFLRRRGYREQGRRHLPIRLESPNAIEPAQTFTAFRVSVLAGARRAGKLGANGMRTMRREHAGCGGGRGSAHDAWW